MRSPTHVHTAVRSWNCWNVDGTVLSRADDALCQAVELMRDGKICALKGIGGFQLIVNARDEAAVARLRLRKRREEKPFAVMYPSSRSSPRDLQGFAA